MWCEGRAMDRGKKEIEEVIGGVEGMLAKK